jgi:hypothetical protein
VGKPLPPPGRLIVPEKILTPRALVIITTIAKAATTITSPITAEVIRSLAFAAAILSPPAIIHWIPPRTMKRNASTAAKKNMMISTLDNIVPRLRRPVTPGQVKVASGAGVAAKAGLARAAKRVIEILIDETNFFILLNSTSF